MTPYDRQYEQDPEGGSAMVEFVIVFPMWVLMTLGIMQLALMHAAANVVTVSAFAAARAATVFQDTDLDDIDPKIPPVMMAIPITGVTTPGNGIDIQVLKKPSGMSGVLDYLLELSLRQLEVSLIPIPKTSVDFFESVDDEGEPEEEKEPEDLKEIVGARCNHHFELVMPVVNQAFVAFIGTGGIEAYSIGGRESMMTEDFMQLLDANFNATILTAIYGNIPHTPINENAIIFRPWADSDDFKEEREE